MLFSMSLDVFVNVLTLNEESGRPVRVLRRPSPPIRAVVTEAVDPFTHRDYGMIR